MAEESPGGVEPGQDCNWEVGEPENACSSEGQKDIQCGDSIPTQPLSTSKRNLADQPRNKVVTSYQILMGFIIGKVKLLHCHQSSGSFYTIFLPFFFWVQVFCTYIFLHDKYSLKFFLLLTARESLREKKTFLYGVNCMALFNHSEIFMQVVLHTTCGETLTSTEGCQAGLQTAIQ